MRIYKVVTIALPTGSPATAWAGAEGKAKKLRRELAEVHDLRPLKDVEITTVDVPSGKAGLLQWLNEEANNGLPKAPAEPVAKTKAKAKPAAKPKTKAKKA